MSSRRSTYAEVVAHLRSASVPVRQLGADSRVAVTQAAGRVVAMAFSPEDENLLWSHPQLGDKELVKHRAEDLTGGFGGDRLWFSPELVYHWDGKPDWGTLANYRVPAATDPGVYEFRDEDPQKITLHAKGELPMHGSDRRLAFHVRRTIRMIEPPLNRNDPLMWEVEYVGIETSHVLKIDESTHSGLIDLWHLLQIPAGAVLVVPVRRTVDESEARPLSYALSGAWIQKSDHILWRFGGEARAKFGLPATALTGRSAVFRELEPDRWCMIVREFPVDPRARYGDHPDGVSRTDQAFQAWDGLGFGEMEFHSPVLDAERGPRELKESDRLWAFGGSARAIAALATELLEVDVTYLFESPRG